MKSVFSRILIRKNQAEKDFCGKLRCLLGFKPKRLQLYRIALRHSSASINSAKKRINNERLEFVGDAVLSMVIADILYTNKPYYDEGELSLIRSKIVCRKNLNKTAFKINLHKVLLCKNQKSINTTNISGNALEALFGAIYYDRGYKYCVRFAQNTLLSDNMDKTLSQNEEDYKSQIYNFSQKHKITVQFNTYENCEINERVQHFLCDLLLNNNYITSGKGWSKKEAEQDCSKKALVFSEEKMLRVARTI